MRYIAAAMLLCVVAAGCTRSTRAPNVTSVSAGVQPSSHNTACPRTFAFTGRIRVNRAGAVTYRWERSDGSKQAAHRVHFAAPGEAAVNDTWTLPSTFSGWQALHVLEPQDVSSDRAGFSLTCPIGVTSVSARVFPATSSRCTETFEFTGTIAASGPLLVTYRWERSDGTSTAPRPVQASSGDPLKVRDSWTVSARPFAGWERLTVVSPARQASDRAEFRKIAPCG